MDLYYERTGPLMSKEENDGQESVNKPWRDMVNIFQQF